MSQGKFSRRDARKEKTAYRADFKKKWQDFMQGEFEGPAQVAFEFGCDPDTAEGWFEGLHAPSGPFVGYAFTRWPDRAAAYLRGVFS